MMECATCFDVVPAGEGYEHPTCGQKYHFECIRVSLENEPGVCAYCDSKILPELERPDEWCFSEPNASECNPHGNWTLRKLYHNRHRMIRAVIAYLQQLYDQFVPFYILPVLPGLTEQFPYFDESVAHMWPCLVEIEQLQDKGIPHIPLVDETYLQIAKEEQKRFNAYANIFATPEKNC